MSVATRIDWNAWRANYDTMSFADHQEFNADCVRLHPEQRCWNGEACDRFLAERWPRTVVELGGWDGSLAADMLARHPRIDVWTNYDISPGVPQACDDPRYQRVVLDYWPWHYYPQADALIASHVFEHMRAEEVVRLVARWDVGSIYIDCPVGPGPSGWHGYEGSHILEVGSTELLWRLEQVGYKAAYVDNAGGLIAYLDRVNA